MNIKLITKRGSVKQYSENGVKKPTQSPTKLTNVEVPPSGTGKRQSEQRNTSWVITRLGKTIYSIQHRGSTRKGNNTNTKRSERDLHASRLAHTYIT